MGERWVSVAASSTSSSSITLRSVCDVWDWREFTVHLPSPSDLECRVAYMKKENIHITTKVRLEKKNTFKLYNQKSALKQLDLVWPRDDLTFCDREAVICTTIWSNLVWIKRTLDRLLRHSNAVSMTAARMQVISPPLYTPHMPYTRSRSLFWIPLQFAVSLKIIDTCRSSLWWKHLHEFSTGKYWQLPIFERRGAISVPVKSAPAKQRNAAATVKIIDETICEL